MKFSRLLNIFVGVLSIAILIFLYNKTQMVNIEQHNQFIDTLRKLKQLDASWTEEVLRSRVSLNNNYDNIATITTLLEDNRNRWLAFELARLPQVETQKKAYLALLEERTELVEHFKGMNAIFSNSIRYFPTAIAELKEFSGVSISAANKLLNAVLKYSLVPDAETRAQIPQLIAALQANADTDEDLIDQIDIISSHANAILKYKPEIDEVLEKIVILNAASVLDSLTDTYVELQNVQLLEREPYRQALIIFSALLLLWIAYIGYRLRLSYKALDVANKQLHTTNENLEKRVEERTKELSDTLRRLKESQSQLIQSEKMASLGQMVAGVTHEINTPLGYVKSNVQLIQSLVVQFEEFLQAHGKLMALFDSETVDEEKLHSQLEIVRGLMTEFQEDEILKEAEELLNDSLHGLSDISDLVINLKNFSRLDLAKLSNVDLHECLEKSLLIVKHLLKNKVTVNKQYGEIPKIKCSPSQINQVFLNLLINAADAIETKGTILIKTGTKNGRVFVGIQDDGRGIAKNILPKIFDPFFTTKKVGEGTGIGLSITYKIIQQHNGNINVTSEVGKGTTFVVILPIQ